MKRNYQGAIKRIEQIAAAHPAVGSVDVGRDLEFDVNKTNLWPRVFIKPVSGQVLGGQGTAEMFITMNVMVMDRLTTDRANMVDVHATTHQILTDFMATLNKEQFTRTTDNPTFVAVADYQDSQSAGWEVVLRIYLDSGYECYPVPD